MYNFEIGSDTYYLPKDLSDIKLRKYREMSKWYDNNPVPKTKPVNNYIEFISLFLNIEKDELKKVKVSAKDGFGIVQLYEYLLNFLELPDFEKFDPVTEFKHKRINYYYIDANLDKIVKEKKPFEDLTFEEYEDCLTILQNFEALSGKNNDAFSLLAAVLFRPKIKKWFGFKTEIEPYNTETANKRAELFQDVSMDKIFSAYFFLEKRMILLTNALSQYLKKEEVNLLNMGGMA